MVTDTEVRVDLPRDDPKLSQSMTAPHNKGRPTMFRTEVMGSPIVIQRDNNDVFRTSQLRSTVRIWRPLPQCAATRPELGEPRVIPHRATAQVHKSLTGLVAGSSTPAPLVRSPHRDPISHLLSVSIYQLPSSHSSLSSPPIFVHLQSRCLSSPRFTLARSVSSCIDLIILRRSCSELFRGRTAAALSDLHDTLLERSASELITSLLPAVQR